MKELSIKEKELLLRDLCGRLPYNFVYCYCNAPFAEGKPIVLTPVVISNLMNATDDLVIKPYLRPMSSMIEEEEKIMRSCGFELIPYDTDHTGFANTENCIDEVSFRFMEEFLNSHHFDYHGLIEKGLALEAPKDMYNTKIK